MTNIFFKVKEWIDHHRDTIDLTIGGGIGVGTGVDHYWDHFFQDENLFKLYDGIFNTCLHTIIGAVLLWAIHKFILKNKKS
jgi:hypothetical protein